MRALRLFEKMLFWLNTPLLKIKEYACTLANKEKGFFKSKVDSD